MPGEFTPYGYCAAVSPPDRSCEYDCWARQTLLSWIAVAEIVPNVCYDGLSPE